MSKKRRKHRARKKRVEECEEKALESPIKFLLSPLLCKFKVKLKRERKIQLILLILAVLIVLLEPLSYLILRIALAAPIPLAIIISPSMTPTLNIGDIVFIKNVNPETLKIGDIIAFNKIAIPTPTGEYKIYERPLTIHRIINIRIQNGKIYFRTKGDANPQPDPWYVPENGVVGVIVGKTQKIGFTIFNNTFKATIITIIFFIILIIEIKKEIFKAL